MGFVMRYCILIYSIIATIISNIWRRFFFGPKYEDWSLKLELEIACVIEAVKVFDSRCDFSWQEIRFMQNISAKWCLPWEAIIEKVNCNGIRGEFITSNSIKGIPRVTVLYLHGGGYCLGSCTSYRKPILNLSKITEVTAISTKIKSSEPFSPFRICKIT